MPSSHRDAFSLLEVVICLLIFGLALQPIMQMLTASHRMSVSARHLLDATVQAQTLLEAVGQLSTAELPPIPPGTETVILPARGVASGAGRWREVAAFFARPTPIPMDRRVIARRFPTGELQLRVEVDWIALVHDEKTRQTLSLATFSTPRSW